MAPIEEKPTQHRLRWFGHVQRRPPEARNGVLERVDNVKRGRGRPKLTWDESVKRDLKDWNISKEIALDENNDGSLKKISCIDPQEGYLESSYQCA